MRDPADQRFLSHRWANPIQPQLPRSRALLTDASKWISHIYREGPWGTITILPMPPPNPLQQLQGLDRSSPEFPNRLADILGEDWMNHAQNLSPNDLEEFVEYLDSVCVRVTLTHPLLNGIVGPQRPQPHQPRLLSLFV